jgi:serine/threonine-protein kinase
VVATLDYASPEQIKGQTLDHRTDIYALGCVLYKLLTGTVPFPGDSIATRVYGHLNSLARAPSSMVADLPAAFDIVVATAMAKEADDRYPTCRALARAALAALTDPAAPAPPAGPPAGPDLTTTVARRPADTATGPATGAPIGPATGSDSPPVPAADSRLGYPSGPPTGAHGPGGPSEPLPAWLSGRMAPPPVVGTTPPPVRTFGSTGTTDRPGRPPDGAHRGPATWPETQEHQGASGEPPAASRALTTPPAGGAARAAPVTGGSSRRSRPRGPSWSS